MIEFGKHLLEKGEKIEEEKRLGRHGTLYLTSEDCRICTRGDGICNYHHHKFQTVIRREEHLSRHRRWQTSSRLMGAAEETMSDILLELKIEIPDQQAGSFPPILEGRLVEHIPQPPLSAVKTADDPPARSPGRTPALQGVLLILAAVLTLLLLKPTQQGAMRLFVSLVPAVGPSVTITLVTDRVAVQKAYTLLAAPAGVDISAALHRQYQAQIGARLLAARTSSQEVTVPTTGKGHDPATYAHGTLTFYNEAPTTQVLSAGLLLTGTDGVQVETEQQTIVPPAQLPTLGETSVAAHTVQVGSVGNIGVDDLNGPCCAAGIAVQNRQAFSGGQDARDFRAVGARDVGQAAKTLAGMLFNQGQAAVQAQVRADERLVYPVQCSPHVTSTPAVGEEAAQVRVEVQAECHALTYNAAALQEQAATLLSGEVTMRLGSAYILQGEVKSTLTAITIIDVQRGAVALRVVARGLWAYQLGSDRLRALPGLVAGKPFKVAQEMLLRMQGIDQVTITSTDWWDDAGELSLPRDPGKIRVVVINWGNRLVVL